VESGLSLGGGSIYYGTVDATPLFVVLLAEVARWGAEPREVAALGVARDERAARLEPAQRARKGIELDEGEGMPEMRGVVGRDAAHVQRDRALGQPLPGGRQRVEQQQGTHVA
jgi:hypothetical protein